MAPGRKKSTVYTKELIRLVRQRPYIYDSRDPLYNDNSEKERGWDEIVHIMFPNWESLPSGIQKQKLTDIRMRWRSLKNTYRKYLREEHERRSRAAATQKRLYVFARYLEFLKPVLELRSTQASWEQEEDDEEEEEEGEAMACSNADLSLEQHALAESLSPPSSPHLPEPRGAEPSTSTSRSHRSTALSRRSSTRPRRVENMDRAHRLLNIVSRISEQMDAQRCPDTLFALSLVPLFKEVIPDRYFEMRTAVQKCIHSFSFPRQLSIQTKEASYAPPTVIPLHSAPITTTQPHPSSYSFPTSVFGTTPPF
ncbi:uncharacterized protein [Aquarana catesbeiana]|uniref:uncharacterized protein n=1 Tax=Aquarana catesbeiana TaxID=8400 RepID=UPI003CC99D1A